MFLYDGLQSTGYLDAIKITSLMACDRFASQEVQPVDNRLIVKITLFDVCKPRSKVSGQKTEARVMVV
jgi:hypothetical protein